jgi:hypothetical protein
MKALKVIVLILVLIGALNRGAMGFFDFNAVTWLMDIVFPAMTNAETLELIVNENAMKFTTIIYDVV